MVMGAGDGTGTRETTTTGDGDGADTRGQMTCNWSGRRYTEKTP